jgi:hypothetical protein
MFNILIFRKECETIMTVIASSNTDVPAEQKINNATAFLQSVVGRVLTLVAADSSIPGVKTSIFRYFNGSNGYPNTLNNSTNLVFKLRAWLSGYLGCLLTNPPPMSASSRNLTSSHASLSISYSDAVLFNTRIISAFRLVLSSQNVSVTSGDIPPLLDEIARDLDSLTPSYTVPSGTTFCDKYANKIAASGIRSNVSDDLFGTLNYTNILGSAAVDREYQTNLAARGPAYAFWHFFVKHAIVFGELVGNVTVNQQLGAYFDGSRSATPNYFANGGNNANLAALVDKLVAWFGAATGCSDLEFLPFARGTGAVIGSTRIDLSTSHQGLRITPFHSSLFNGAILRRVVATLNSFDLTNADVAAVANLLNSVDAQVAYAGPLQRAPSSPSSAPSNGKTASTAAISASLSSFALFAFAFAALIL